MRTLALMLGFASLALSACATTGPVVPAGTVDSAVSIGHSGIDAAANAFDAGLYALDIAMDVHLLTPGSDQAKKIAAVGRDVQKYLNAADQALSANNVAAAKAALDQANSAISLFRSLLPAHGTTGMAVPPPLTPHSRAEILARAAA